MVRCLFLFFVLAVCFQSVAQLPVARDTITVIESGVVQKMPWANGINYANVSNIDLNGDGKKDLVLYDKLNQFGTGRFRCFVNVGAPGQALYRADLGLSYNFPTVSNWGVFLDYDCDGKEDLFCSTSAGIMVYRNTSNNSNTLQFTLIKSLLTTDYNPGGNPYISNLYASSVGVPGIADIDKDGDLDILTFAPQGVFVEYHKNMSKEKGYRCDSLIFQIDDMCWGKISESSCVISMSVCGQNFNPLFKPQKVQHAGSCLTCLDSDGDKDEDLIMGDISCNTVQYAHNGGSTTSALIVDTTKLYPNYPVKGNTQQINVNNFPCTYYVDADGDAVRDLIATPNTFGSENYKSVWYYHNASTTPTVNFQFVKKNFLQDEMIEVGQNSFPVLFDHNSDGKKDLLVGTYGYYTGNSLSARLTLYENIGTGSVPVFSLITRDYGNLSAQNLNNVIPAVGDIDGDGDTDILIGTSTGQIHWLENTAGSGNSCIFSVFKNNPFNFTTASAVAAPQLFDLDGDNLLDLIVGTKNGRLAFFKNNGTATVPAFTLITNFLGSVDVKGNPYLYGLDGYAVPFFFKQGSSTECLIGSVSGGIWHFNVPGTLTASFTLISNAENALNEGAQSAPWFEDIDGDGKRDLILGNAGGGLTYFSSSSPYVGLSEFDPVQLGLHISVFPNPTNTDCNIKISNMDFDSASLELYDLSGRILLKEKMQYNFGSVALEPFEKGLYIIKIIVTTNGRNYSANKTISRN
jgi:hypothetical protein